MKKLMTICGLVGLLVVTSPAGIYVVEIGTPASENLFAPVEWGPIEPTFSGGNWGNIAADPLSNDNLCRTVWGNPTATLDVANWASLTFPEKIQSLTIRHLDGLALDPAGGGADDFDVYVDNVLWGSYASNPATNEYWLTTGYAGVPGFTLKIVETDPPWTSFGSYGQLGIDRIEAVPVPAPGALVLAVMGISLGGWLCGRRKAQGRAKIIHEQPGGL